MFWLPPCDPVKKSYGFVIVRHRCPINWHFMFTNTAKIHVFSALVQSESVTIFHSPQWSQTESVTISHNLSQRSSRMTYCFVYKYIHLSIREPLSVTVLHSYLGLWELHLKHELSLQTLDSRWSIQPKYGTVVNYKTTSTMACTAPHLTLVVISGGRRQFLTIPRSKLHLRMVYRICDFRIF